MRTIWKFNTPFKEKFQVVMPIGAKLRFVGLDKDNIPCIWAEVNTMEAEEERFFELIGTGNDMTGDMGIERKYVGSYRYQNGEFIGHIYERIN